MRSSRSGKKMFSEPPTVEDSNCLSRDFTFRRMEFSRIYAVIDRDTGIDADGIHYFASDWTFLANGFAQ